MDTQFHPNNMNSSNSSYNCLPGISPHQLQQNSSLPAHTLPPLQTPTHSSLQSIYGSSAPQTPRTLATPNTPTSATSMNFPQMCQSSTRYHLMPYDSQHPRGYQMMPNSHEQVYRPMRAMVPHSSGTTTMPYPQAIAPAPLNRMPQAIRPSSQNGLHMQPAVQASYGQSNILTQMSDIESPTHVVGSQGRRGILPSAPGRPPVTSSTGKGALIPCKDADGKFPCPHCTKTYLHAKHLKRHLLRHTGDRPYMCILCRDTFSRSDILKRHFQKCSLRRGNPTGASHLSHSQAYLKKSHSNPQKTTNDDKINEMNGLANSNGGVPMYRVIPDVKIPESGSNLNESEHLQINCSKRVNVGTENNGRGGLTGINPSVSNRSAMDQSYTGTTSATMPSALSSAMTSSVAFNMSQGQNNHPYNQTYNYPSNGSNNNAHSNQRPEIKKDEESMFSYNRGSCHFREPQGQA